MGGIGKNKWEARTRRDEGEINLAAGGCLRLSRRTSRRYRVYPCLLGGVPWGTTNEIISGGWAKTGKGAQPPTRHMLRAPRRKGWLYLPAGLGGGEGVTQVHRERRRERDRGIEGEKHRGRRGTP